MISQRRKPEERGNERGKEVTGSERVKKGGRQTKKKKRKRW